MRRRHLHATISLAASLAAAAALAPGAAHASADLAGAPTLRVLDAKQIGLQIAVDEKLRTEHNDADVRVTVKGRPLAHLQISGRHGRAFLYAGSLARKGFEVGRTYTVRITFPGQETVVRKVKLHPRRA
jgi:hypothetical protein